MTHPETRSHDETMKIVAELALAIAENNRELIAELGEQLAGKRKPYVRPDFEQPTNPARFEVTRRVLLLRRFAEDELVAEYRYLPEDVTSALQELLDLGYIVIDPTAPTDGRVHYCLTDDRNKRLELSRSIEAVFYRELPESEYRHR